MEVDSSAKQSRSRDSWKLIKQGAEARVYEGEFSGKPAIIKERFTKTYRLPELDHKLTHRRMNQEVRSIARCQKSGIRVPEVYYVDTKERLIFMELISDGFVMKDYINQFDLVKDQVVLEGLMKVIAVTIANMHNIDLVHGDLTTSNMIYNPDKKELTMIDFGLSSVSKSVEDKGVDLYVLERAFLSTHPNTEDLFEIILRDYRSACNNAETVLAKLDEVRMRGRKRSMVG